MAVACVVWGAWVMMLKRASMLLLKAEIVEISSTEYHTVYLTEHSMIDQYWQHDRALATSYIF